MTPEMHQTVNHLLHAYKRTGAKSYRRKQVKRLMFMLNNIIQHEKNPTLQLHQLGRKQIIGFWRRHQHLSESTKNEYWRIVEILFECLGKAPPPKPKKSKK
jgi:hypothetical protein